VYYQSLVASRWSFAKTRDDDARFPEVLADHQRPATNAALKKSAQKRKIVLTLCSHCRNIL